VGPTFNVGPTGVPAAACDNRLVRTDSRLGPIEFTVTNAAFRGVKVRFADCRFDPDNLLDCTVDQVDIERFATVIRYVKQPARELRVDGTLRLEPVRGMKGTLRTFVQDALWRLDVEAIVPFANGGVDLRQIDINHVGPDSRVDVGPTGICVYPPGGRPMEVLRFNSNEIRMNGSTLDLVSLIEHVIRADRSQPLATVDARINSAAARLQVNGQLQLGDGTLGDASRAIVLSGAALGANCVEVASPGLGQQLTFRIPRFVASAVQAPLAGFEATMGAMSASIEGRAVPSAAANGAPASLRLEIAVSQINARDVRVARSRNVTTTS